MLDIAWTMVVNSVNWLLLCVFINIPLDIVVPTFFMMLVMLWPRVCAPDRGMESGGVVAIVSFGRRVVLG